MPKDDENSIRFEVWRQNGAAPQPTPDKSDASDTNAIAQFKAAVAEEVTKKSITTDQYKEITGEDYVA